SVKPGRRVKGPNTPLLELPSLGPTQAEKVQTQLTLICEPGLVLQPQVKTLKNLKRQGPAGARPLVYLSKSACGPGTFAVLPAGPAPHATIRTEVARRGKDLVFASTIDYRPQGESRQVEVRLRHW